MQVHPRVLGYLSAKELNKEELSNVSGGSAKLTCQIEQKGTGAPPGPVDAVVIEVWD